MKILVWSDKSNTGSLTDIKSYQVLSSITKSEIHSA